MDAAFHQRTQQKGVFHCFQELHGMLFPAYQHVQLEPSPHKACFKCVKWRSLQAGMLVEELVPGTVRACCYSPSRPGALSVIFRTVYVRTYVCTYVQYAHSFCMCHQRKGVIGMNVCASAPLLFHVLSRAVYFMCCQGLCISCVVISCVVKGCVFHVLSRAVYFMCYQGLCVIDQMCRWCLCLPAA